MDAAQVSLMQQPDLAHFLPSARSMRRRGCIIASVVGFMRRGYACWRGRKHCEGVRAFSVAYVIGPEAEKRGTEDVPPRLVVRQNAAA